jgi:VCBS repeat-containing protein
MLAIVHDTTLTIAARGVLKNDGSLAVTATLVSSPAHGTVALNANGALIYTPAAGFSGKDTFLYAARSASGVTGPVATVTIRVRPNLAPDADNDYYTTKRNTTLTTTAAHGVLVGDSDPNGDALTALPVSGPSHGMLTLSADGSFVYKPPSNYTGTDTFTYRARDPFGLTDTATVTIKVVSQPKDDDCGDGRHDSHHDDHDGCDHDKHRNGHFDGDGCEHDRR